MPQIMFISVVCIALLAACDNTKSDTQSQNTNSPPQVEPLKRIAQDSEGVSTTSRQIAFSRGQVIFVPAYSHIYHGDRHEQFPLTITLSIRNTSLTDAIIIRSVRYYNSGGKLVKDYTEGNLQLAPLATAEFFIPQRDSSGGSGANFIFEWVAGKKSVTEPRIEAVMIGTSYQQGVSFTTAGEVIQELKP
jgi:hypothetical protein